MVLGLRALLALEGCALSLASAKRLTTTVTTVLGYVMASSDLLVLPHTWDVHTCTLAYPHAHLKKKKRRSLISKRLKTKVKEGSMASTGDAHA